MKHLFSVSAYQFDLDSFGGSADAVRRIRDAGADGIELLTGYFDPDPVLKNFTESVHLPYATDWYSAWTGDTSYIDIVNDENIKHRSYGRNAKEIEKTLKEAIDTASPFGPAYGVLHASNTRMDEVMGFTHRDTDSDVLYALADIMNRVASSFPGGEPPFRIAFENIWWPGLRMTDASGYELLRDKLNFDNWGLCLDTGHLMNALGHCRYEEKSIDDVLSVIRGYPREMTDRIGVTHLHMSLSADYTDECMRNPKRFDSADDNGMISQAYEHVCMIDQHRPFTSDECIKIVDAVRPGYVTHEISGSSAEDRLSGFAEQRSLFR